MADTMVAVETVPPPARGSDPREPIAVDAALLLLGVAVFVVACYSWLGIGGGLRVACTVLSLALVFTMTVTTLMASERAYHIAARV